MAEHALATGANEAAWIADQRRWATGWRRIVFPTVFLAWLVEVGTGVGSDSHGWSAVAGYTILGAFCVCYMVGLQAAWRPNSRIHLPLVCVLSALTLAELPFAQANALIMAVFVCVVAVIRYGERGLLLVAVFTLLAIFLPVLVPSWHGGYGTGLNNGTALAIPLTGLAMLGFGRVINGNRVLADTRAELARLSAENERIRIARDLHDLLGHSLTTITVKASLARRLGEVDVEGALREIAEVESLSRRALGDVRAAVTAYRDVNLVNELATGRELLRAAGIVAELPPAADVVDEETQELFGWVVREGLTNVVRHSHATTCTVRLSPQSVEIVDDGVGPEGGCGNGSGLTGLAERVAGAGGSLEAGPGRSGGWRLAVQLTGAGSA